MLLNESRLQDGSSSCLDACTILDLVGSRSEINWMAGVKYETLTSDSDGTVCILKLDFIAQTQTTDNAEPVASGKPLLFGDRPICMYASCCPERNVLRLAATI